jgi:hypothetical protein
MAQFGRPSTDTTREAWEEDDGTTASIFDQIDEVAADDGDYIRSALVPTSDVYVTKLTAVTDPLQSTGHTVRYRYGKDAASGAQIDIIVQLRQGYVSEGTPGTLIAAQTHTNVAVFPVAGSIVLSGAEADAITNYADLFLRFVANQV